MFLYIDGLLMFIGFEMASLAAIYLLGGWLAGSLKVGGWWFQGTPKNRFHHSHGNMWPFQLISINWRDPNFWWLNLTNWLLNSHKNMGYSCLYIYLYIIIHYNVYIYIIWQISIPFYIAMNIPLVKSHQPPTARNPKDGSRHSPRSSHPWRLLQEGNPGDATGFTPGKTSMLWGWWIRNG